MSDYKVFIKDFPERCEKLLKRIEIDNIFDDLTVTGLLTVASAAINIPYERLLAPSQYRSSHPSGDYKNFVEAAQQFNQLLKSNFVGSRLYTINITENWRLAKQESVTGTPDAWDRPFEKISNRMEISFVLTIIRNALAHGNIFTKAEETPRRKIQEIILVSEQREYDKNGKPMVKYYNCISVTPTIFKQFLNEWFAFIKTLKIPDSYYCNCCTD